MELGSSKFWTGVFMAGALIAPLTQAQELMDDTSPVAFQKKLIRKIRRNARANSDSPEFLNALATILASERRGCTAAPLIREVRRLRRADDVKAWKLRSPYESCGQASADEKRSAQQKAKQLIVSFANPEIISCTRGELSVRAALVLGLGASIGAMTCKYTDYTTRIYIGGGPSLQFYGGAIVTLKRSHYDRRMKYNDEDAVELVGRRGAYFEDYNTDMAFFAGHTEEFFFPNRQVSTLATMREGMEQTESVGVGMGVLTGFGLKPYVAIGHFTRWNELL